MATPMEYDTLIEIYSSARASLSRLKTKYSIDIEQFEDDKDRFIQIWTKKVQSVDLKDIDYKAVTLKMKEAAEPWVACEKKAESE